MGTDRSSSARGAYGFRLEGLDAPEALLVAATDHWPVLRLARETGHERPPQEEIGERHARLWLAAGGSAELDGPGLSARIRVPRGTPESALVHPLLAPVALVMARWHGGEGFHGGGIVAGGGVWGVLGGKTAGKSTTLAWLALAGVEVVSDDLLVVVGDTVVAGPRSVDLRTEAAHALGAGEPLGRIGERERWRLALPQIAPDLPLRGWVTLEWGDEIAVEPIRGARRLPALLSHRGVRVEPVDPAALVRLSALPHVRFVRPRRWASLPESAERLLDAISG